MEELTGPGLTGVIVALALVAMRIADKALARRSNNPGNSFRPDDREALQRTDRGMVGLSKDVHALLNETKEQTIVMREVCDSLQTRGPD